MNYQLTQHAAVLYVFYPSQSSHTNRATAFATTSVVAYMGIKSGHGIIESDLSFWRCCDLAFCRMQEHRQRPTNSAAAQVPAVRLY